MLLCKNKKNSQKESNIDSNKTKIHMLSSKQRTKHHKSDQKIKINNRLSVRSQPVVLDQRPSHISTIDSFSCNIFNQCGEIPIIDEG